MNPNLPDLESFLRDVRDHQLTVIRDDKDGGNYRHLRFAKPGTYCMGFDLITWPGNLCYCGDMGTYVFQRLPDMLDFFRKDKRADGSWSIDLRYWAEKAQGVDNNSGLKEYSPTLLRSAVAEYMDNREASAEVREEVQDSILNHADDEFEVVKAIRDFDFQGFTFVDFWEYNIKDFTHRFRWCCFALAWAVEKYDARPVVTA